MDRNLQKPGKGILFAGRFKLIKEEQGSLLVSVPINSMMRKPKQQGRNLERKVPEFGTGRIKVVPGEHADDPGRHWEHVVRL